MPVPPPLRLVRATVFAAVCVLLTSAGHLLASGGPVAPWTAAFGFAGVLGAALALAGHERSLATILGGLLLGQFALHSLFAAGHGGHHGALPAAEDDGGGSLGMTAAHLLAALASAWWLRRGERQAWRLARQAARVLALPFLLVTVTPGAPARSAAVPPCPPRVRPAVAVLRHVLVLRGPPARSGALSGA
ncbi:hypothetical protein GCM10023085_20200 [Actinomadura viridis]|uniref:Uncharacterized protein n=1 Tax=Actinomadura viridis TaxID=58110 RepID=A0A931GJ22_9ACTN|nr:hypothetical protein [Actinomadura viridis]MBG6089223.1 hypothetical protein [Actinomadura viridis]